MESVADRQSARYIPDAATDTVRRGDSRGGGEEAKRPLRVRVPCTAEKGGGGGGGGGREVEERRIRKALARKQREGALYSPG